MLKRLVFVIFLAFSILGVPAFAKTTAVHDVLPIEKGVFSGAGQSYSFEKSPEFVHIYDAMGHILFSSRCLDGHSLILACGYSQTFSSLYVLKETFSSQSKRYDLIMELPSYTMTLVSGSPRAFYSPILIEHNGFHLAYLDDNSSIVLLDGRNGNVMQRLKSAVPMRNLRRDSVGDIPDLLFDRFDLKIGRLVSEVVDVSRIGMAPCLIMEPSIREDQQRERMPHLPLSSTSDLARDPKKTIGFGDSITYGYINKEPYPEVGYIPRLLDMLRQEIYEDAELVNEGVGGTTTGEALLRIDWVIQADNAQNLLFHYGTNDILYANTLPVSEILYNITEMIDSVLESGMTPVLSTLIPRNRIAADGIWLERASEICQGIRGLAQTKNIPLVDFWTLFSEYPAEAGGYFSLMSDNVHPSEKGYQLMAEEWHKVLLAFPPQMPQLATSSALVSARALVQWPENEELDLQHYFIRYGYQADRLEQTSMVEIPAIEFVWFPFYGPSRRTIYFQVQAFDKNGAMSPMTPVQEVGFSAAFSRAKSK